MEQAENTLVAVKDAALPRESAKAKDEPQANIAPSQQPDIPARKLKRTPGLKFFDAVLYNFVNVSVFVISVVATYLTTKGGDKDASGKLIYGETGKFFQKRGDWLIKKFTALGMSEKSADMSKMVFFSFADGSVMAPVVKAVEGHRPEIARWCDKKLGTTPADDRVYDAEPRQSWTSVLGGRAATAAVVVSTAVALDKTGLNDKLFRNPGKKIGEWVKKTPKLAAMFGKHDIGELSKVSLFEAFYTTVCTVGLYYTSRFFARGLNKHKEKKEEKHAMNYLAKQGVTIVENDGVENTASPTIKLRPFADMATITGKADAANADRVVIPVLGKATAKIAKDRASANDAQALGVA